MKIGVCPECNGRGLVQSRPGGTNATICKVCHGRGDVDTEEKLLCIHCNGHGIQHVGYYTVKMPQACTYCGGSGKVSMKGEARTMANPADEQKEAVNHPQHYNTGKFEVIDVIEDWELGFNDGNAVKYIGRHKHKGRPVEDLKKSLWYIARELVSEYNVPPEELSTYVLTVRK